MDTPIPPGFTKAESRGPFTTHNGPVYVADDPPPGRTRMGLRILDRHCNGLGFFHGGMASAFCDGLMAHASWAESRRRAVTLKIAIEYFDIVREGDWLVGDAWAVSSDDDIVHVACDLRVGESLKARGRSAFRLLRRRD